MMDDIISLFNYLGVENTNLLGHSMGGKLAMIIALLKPKYVNKLIVADIAPINYDNDEKLIIKPIRCSHLDGKSHNIQAQLRRNNGQKIKIGYHFVKDSKLDKWLLNNLCIDRICIVNSYKSQLSSLKAKSAEQMLNMLRKHNRNIKD